MNFKKIQRNIEAKYKWELVDFMGNFYFSEFNAFCIGNPGNFSCLVFPKSAEKLDFIMNNIKEYEEKYNIKLPIIQIIDYKTIDKLSYIFYEKLPIYEDNNKEELIFSILHLFNFTKQLNCTFYFYTNLLYTKNNKFYFNIFGMNPIILFCMNWLNSKRFLMIYNLTNLL